MPILIAAGCLAIVFTLVLTASIQRHDNWGGSSYVSNPMQLPPVRITVHDLEEYANGSRSDRDLAQFLQRCAEASSFSGRPDPDQLAVVFIGPHALRGIWVQFGWPVGWLSTDTVSCFVDYYAHDGQHMPEHWHVGPSATGRWNWEIPHLPFRGDIVGQTLVFSHANATGIATSLLLGLVGWHVAIAALRLTGSLWRGEGRSRWPSRAAAGALSIGIIYASLTHTQRSESLFGEDLADWDPPNSIVDALSRDRVAQLASTHAGQSELAQIILQSLRATPSPELVLMAGFPRMVPVLMDEWATNWPHVGVVRIERFTRVEANGEARPTPEFADRGMSVAVSDGALRIQAISATPPSTLRVCSLDLGFVASAALLAWAVWYVIRLGCHAVLTGFVKRRFRRGLCVECGYDLSPVSRC